MSTYRVFVDGWESGSLPFLHARTDVVEGGKEEIEALHKQLCRLVYDCA